MEVTTSSTAAAKPANPRGLRVSAAIREGLGALGRVRREIVVAYLVSVLIALPLAAVMYTMLAEELGNSIVADNMRRGFDDLWHRGFSARARGLGKTFGSSVVGIGAVFDGLDAMIKGALFRVHAAVVAAGGVYLAAWVFLSGGFYARFVTPADGRGFFGACAAHFRRLALLTAAAVLVYYLVFAWAWGPLGSYVNDATREVIDERVHAGYVAGKYAIVWLGLWASSLTFDYARIVAVARPGRPLLRCVADGATLVLRRAGAVFGLSLALWLVFVAVVLGYWAIAPDSTQDGTGSILIAFLIGQLFVLARVTTRCLFFASQAAWARSVGFAPAPE